MRKLFALSAMILLLAAIAPPPAQACFQCNWYLVCTWDCYVVGACESAQFPNGGSLECIEYSNGDCRTLGGLCSWA